jgi:hypothetical protein
MAAVWTVRFVQHQSHQSPTADLNGAPFCNWQPTPNQSVPLANSGKPQSYQISSADTLNDTMASNNQAQII